MKRLAKHFCADRTSHRHYEENLLQKSVTPESVRAGNASRIAGEDQVSDRYQRERAETPRPTPADYSAALSRLAELSRKGGLNDRSVNRFAVQHEYVEVAAALSFLSGTPVEVIVPVIESRRHGGTDGSLQGRQA